MVVAAAVVVDSGGGGENVNSVEFIVNELLCATQFYLKTLPNSEILSLIGEFYNGDELLSAKTLLFATAKKAHPETPPLVMRKGVNKRRSDIEDIVNLFTLADVKKVLLPTFVAVNLNRVPPVLSSVSWAHQSQSPSSTEALEVAVSDLQTQMAAVLNKLDDIKASNMAIVSSHNHLPSAVDQTQGFAPLAASMPALDVQGTPSWSTVARKLAANSEAFKTSPNSSRITFKGRRVAAGAVKAVPRPLMCFVGRLDNKTTSEDLHGYLASVGIMNAVCRKLIPKDGKVFRTSAFCVSCNPEFADLFYDELNWPDNVELRDWYFRPKNGST